MMTTDTTEGTTEAEEVATWPERVGLAELRDVLDHSGLRFRFEEWTSNFWLNATGSHYTARIHLRRLERLGVAPDALQAERVRLDCAQAQVEEFAFLAAAHSEHDGLDYSDALTYKYLALWLWATNGGRALYSDEREVNLPLDWADVLAPDLLALPAFNCHA